MTYLTWQDALAMAFFPASAVTVWFYLMWLKQEDVDKSDPNERGDYDL